MQVFTAQYFDWDYIQVHQRFKTNMSLFKIIDIIFEFFDNINKND